MPEFVISTVTFDAGNTLLYCDPSPAEIYSRELGRHGRAVAVEDVAPVFSDAWADLQERTPPGIDRYSSQPGGEKAWWGAFLRDVLTRLDHDAAWQPLLDDLYAAFSQPDVWKTYPETRQTLEAVGARGLRMGVISNWDRRLPEILTTLDLDRYFGAVTVSAIEGVEKPAASIFHRALDRLGVRPEEAMHVGDSPLEDYQGAEGVGMRSVLIDRPGAFALNGYRRIASLDQVLQMIG